MAPQRYTVTSALPYANGPVHIGQLAGAYLPADIFVRYLRLNNEDVIFICGSDEHGSPITLRAKQEGITPKEIVDKYHDQLKESFEAFGIAFDYYHRTSSELHHQTARDFFSKCYEQGLFFEKEGKQFYDEDYQMFLADRYIVGQCPKCGHENAYGDQCEKCGTSLSPNELIEPRSVLSGKEPVKRNTKHWYLPLDKIQANWLENWIDQQEGKWKKNVFGQCKSWLDQGLQPRGVTRDLEWGVQVPLEDAEGKVLYIWFDAPIGYISATKAWAQDTGNDWEPYWKDDNTKLVHFIGKDNIVFHCLVFPAMLGEHGDFILPDNVPANEFMNMEGEKISTSRNWAVWLHEYLEDFPGKEDILRYVLTTNLPETKDSDFTWKDFQEKNNSELVGILGNFINRTLILTHKYFKGQVPALQEDKLTDTDRELLDQIPSFGDAVGTAIGNYQMRKAVNDMMDLARHGNKYLTDREPWKLYNDDPDAVANILYINLQVIGSLAILMHPFMPFSSKKVQSMLNLGDDYRQWGNVGKKELVPAGHELNKPEHLFDKIEDRVVEEQRAKLGTGEDQEDEVPDISIEDFRKMDIRIGTIKQAEKVPQADKLLKLQVEIGDEIRQVVSGIARQYDPEHITGTQVCLLANLAPRKVKGVQSQGMILMAENDDGELAFVSPISVVKDGSPVR